MWKSPRATALSKSAILLAALLVGAQTASAQTTAVICGTVTDTLGNLMPGVAVTLNVATAPPSSAIADKSGGYVFAGVTPAMYSLTFELAGFKKTVRLGVLVSEGREFHVDQRMEVASRAETDDVLLPATPTVAYDRPRTKTGATFTKDILTVVSTSRSVPARPCKIEKH